MEQVTGHPAAELGCPWASAFEPDVLAVIAAHEWWPAIETWTGPDPESWLVEGVAIYRRALEASRADAAEVLRKRK